MRARVAVYDLETVAKASVPIPGHVTDTYLVYRAASSRSKRFIDLVYSGRAPYAITVDRGGNLYVADPSVEEGLIDTGTAASISVFAPNTSASAKPWRLIHGPHTRLSHPVGLATDESGNLYVANAAGFEFYTNRRRSAVLVFSPQADGDATPIRQVYGPQTGLQSVRAIAVGPDGFLYVSGGHTLGGPMSPFFINVYAPSATGDQAPIRRIVGEAPTYAEYINLLQQRETWIKKNGLDKFMTGDPTDLVYELHNNPKLNHPIQMTFDRDGNLWVANLGGWRITEFAPGASGNVPPIRIIEGGKTGLLQPVGIAVDGDGNVYVSNFDRGVNEYCISGM